MYPQGPVGGLFRKWSPSHQHLTHSKEEAELLQYFLSRVRGDQGAPEQQQRGEFLREFKTGRELCV